jgi:hypothetical protein
LTTIGQRIANSPICPLTLNDDRSTVLAVNVISPMQFVTIE